MILCALLDFRKHLLLEEKWRFRSKESGKKNWMIPPKKSVSGSMKMKAWSIGMKYDHNSRESSSIMMENKKGFSQAQLKWNFCGKKVLAAVAVVVVEAKFAFFPISSNREVLPNKWHF